MRRTFNRLLPAALVVTLSLGAARVAFSDGPSDPWRSAPAVPAPVADRDEPTPGGPLILTLGPPPVVYSPSADFGSRVETSPGWAVASDVRTAAVTPLQPVVSTPPMAPAYVPGMPFDAAFPVVPGPCYECPPPMQTAMQPRILPGAPSYFAPPPSPPLMAPAPAVRPPEAYTKYFNPSVVYPSRLAATPGPSAMPYPSQIYSSPSAGEADHVSHILQAVHHLEAAGLQADADRLRRDCDDKVERLIETFKSNEAEMSRLRQSRADIKSESAQSSDQRPPMVTAQLCMLNVDVNKLEALKLDTESSAVKAFAKLFLSHKHGGFDAFPDDQAAFDRAVSELKQRGIVEVLSRPAIATLSGMEARLEVGQSIPHTAFAADGTRLAASEFVGLSAQVCPKVLDENTVRMHVHLRRSQQSGNNEELETIVETHCGEPALLSGLQTNSAGRKTATLVAICPRIVKDEDMPPPLPVAAGYSSACDSGPCGEKVQSASAVMEACPASQSCGGNCACGGAAACGGECGDHCTCGSAACEAKTQANTQKKQIVLHVELLELNHTKARQLGFDFAHVEDKTGKTSISNILSAPQSRGFIEALKKEGVVKVLSNPTICTLSGRAAHFQCGAEFPVPTKHSDGSVSVEYHNVGTQIDCVPITQDDGKLRLEFRARLSAIDASRTLDLGDLHVPCFTAREFDTASELKPGQALIVLGPAENGLVAEMVQVNNCMPDIVESIVDSLGGYFEEHPLVGGAVLGALDQLGCCYAKVECVHHEEELQFVAIIRPEIAGDSAFQPVSMTPPCGCESGCCPGNGFSGSCSPSPACEALLSTRDSSFAVQPAGCWGPSSAANAFFEHALVDTPLLPGPVQHAFLTTPESTNCKPSVGFEFDFQLPVLPPLDLALPEKAPLR